MNHLSFKDINISTVTISIESNLIFDLNEIINCIIENSSSEFQNNILNYQKEIEMKEFKLMKFEPGTISYINFKNIWRGIKRKKIRKGKRKTDFINQATMDVFVLDCIKNIPKRINMMIFRNGKMKLAGCKNTNDAINALEYFWSTIFNYEKCYSLNINLTFMNIEKSYDYEFNNFEINPSFIFTNEMINISFGFSKTLKKTSINNLFAQLEIADDTLDNTQSEFEQDIECTSYYEPTGQQYVTTKLYSNNLYTKKAILLQYIRNKFSDNISEKTYNNIYNIYIIDVEFKKTPKTCFMIFDKKVISSGIDYIVMEKHFNYFIGLIEKNWNFLTISESI